MTDIIDIERYRVEVRAAALDEAASYLASRVAELQKLRGEQITETDKLICVAVLNLARQIRVLKEQS